MATLAPDSWAICLSVVLSKPFLAKRCSAALNILDCVTWLVLLLAAETFGIYPPSDKNLKTNWVRTFPGLHQGSQRGYLPFQFFILIGYCSQAMNVSQGKHKHLFN